MNTKKVMHPHLARGTDLLDYTQPEWNTITSRLNTHPRNRLNFAMLWKTLRTYTSIHPLSLTLKTDFFHIIHVITYL